MLRIGAPRESVRFQGARGFVDSRRHGGGDVAGFADGDVRTKRAIAMCECVNVVGSEFEFQGARPFRGQRRGAVFLTWSVHCQAACGRAHGDLVGSER